MLLIVETYFLLFWVGFFNVEPSSDGLVLIDILMAYGYNFSSDY